MVCPICDSDAESQVLDCLHEACVRCIPIFREQGQLCPASKYCSATGLLLQGETYADALVRNQIAANEIEAKLLATELRLTLKIDATDNDLRNKLDQIGSWERRQIRKLESQAIAQYKEDQVSDTIRLHPALGRVHGYILSLIVNNVSPYEPITDDVADFIPFDYSRCLRRAAEFLGCEERYLDTLSNSDVFSRAHIGVDYYYLAKRTNVLRWTTESGWEIGNWRIPDSTFQYAGRRYEVVNGLSLGLIDRTFDPMVRARKEASLRKKHEKTLMALRTAHTAETDTLYFEAKCTEHNIEAIQMRVEFKLPLPTATMALVPQRLTFIEQNINQLHRDYLNTGADWMVPRSAYNVLPLTASVVVIMGSPMVLHTCSYRGANVRSGNMAVRLRLNEPDRLFVHGDTFWCRHDTKWSGISLALQTLGQDITDEMPLEPICPDDSYHICRREDTREMIWIRLSNIARRPRVMGAIPY
jgi:hypothetical protein